MTRQDWLLLAIQDRIEPIQLQKTLFKFGQESGAPEGELYNFEPYNWGPCSFQIYEDMAQLRDQGLVEMIPTGRGWNIYGMTAIGQQRAAECSNASDLVQCLEQIRTYVVSRDFETLLTDVYDDYPDYARLSLFRK